MTYTEKYEYMVRVSASLARRLKDEDKLSDIIAFLEKTMENIHSFILPLNDKPQSLPAQENAKKNYSNRPTGKYFVVYSRKNKKEDYVETTCLGVPDGEVYFQFRTKHSRDLYCDFIGIVQAMQMMQADGFSRPIYCNSEVPVNWACYKRCGTDWAKYPDMEETRQLVVRALGWLNKNAHQAPNLWHTKQWGKIPTEKNRSHLIPIQK